MSLFVLSLDRLKSADLILKSRQLSLPKIVYYGDQTVTMKAIDKSAERKVNYIIKKIKKDYKK